VDLNFFNQKRQNKPSGQPEKQKTELPASFSSTNLSDVPNSEVSFLGLNF